MYMRYFFMDAFMYPKQCESIRFVSKMVSIIVMYMKYCVDG